MARIARVVVAAYPQHVTQRGNRREEVFFTNADRLRYLELLKAYAESRAKGRRGQRRPLV